MHILWAQDIMEKILVLHGIAVANLGGEMCYTSQDAGHYRPWGTAFLVAAPEGISNAWASLRALPFRLRDDDPRIRWHVSYCV